MGGVTDWGQGEGRCGAKQGEYLPEIPEYPPERGFRAGVPGPLLAPVLPPAFANSPADAPSPISQIEKPSPWCLKAFL